MKNFGGDFEFHFYQNGKAIPAETVLKVDKNAYIAAETTTAEIRPVATNNLDDFLTNTREMLYTLKNANKDLKLVCTPINDLNLDDRSHESVKSLLVDGVEKDNDQFNAYVKKVQSTLLQGTGDLNCDQFRTQGGHIWLHSDIKRADETIKLLDLFLALPCVIMFPERAEAIRRLKYGQAGSYRVNDSLLEYRVLSSSIVSHPEVLKNLLFNAQIINEQFSTISHFAENLGFSKNEHSLKNIINNNDYKKALSLWDKIVAKINGVACVPFKQHILRMDSFIKYYALSKPNWYEDKQNGSGFLKNWLL